MTRVFASEECRVGASRAAGLAADSVIVDFGALTGHHTDKWGVSDLVGGAGDALGAG